MPERPRVIVVGAGPAGLMAAEQAAEAGAQVQVLEAQRQVGRKFLLAGRGGLNLTHSQTLAAFLSAYRGDPWALEAVRRFPPEALRTWVHGLGIATFVGSSGRVFPSEMKASPLLRAWLARLDHLGVSIVTGRRVTGLEIGPRLYVDGPEGSSEHRTQAVVLAMGGASWPRLGSDGAWCSWLPVPTSPLTAANVGMVVPWQDARLQALAGHPLKPVLAWVANAPAESDRQPIRGECILTEDGLEGGVIYALNAALRAALRAHGHAQLTLDLVPDRDLAGLRARLAQTPDKRSHTERLRRASGVSPVALALLAAARAGHVALQVHDLKTLSIRITDTRPLTEAISTAGGVAAAAHDADGMLLAYPGVFVAGEMLDWDAPTGGYLLTACFAMGRAAGQAAAGYAARLLEPATTPCATPWVSTSGPGPT